MMRATEIINVFYSSTNDTGTFDRLAAFSQVSANVETIKNIKFHIIHWKHNIPGGIGRGTAQDVIDAAVAGQYDVYFGCLGPKFGAGTVREYQNAIDGHIQNNEPKCLFFGFDETPVNPYEIDVNSLRRAKKFRSDIGNSNIYGRAMLYFTFSSELEFTNRVLMNLSNAVDKIQTRISGGIRIR